MFVGTTMYSHVLPMYVLACVTYVLTVRSRTCILTIIKSWTFVLCEDNILQTKI